MTPCGDTEATNWMTRNRCDRVAVLLEFGNNSARCEISETGFAINMARQHTLKCFFCQDPPHEDLRKNGEMKSDFSRFTTANTSVLAVFNTILNEYR